MPAAARVAFASALAFAHAGMWVMERLGRPFCARHRALILALGAAAFGIAASAVVLGAALLLRVARGAGL